MLGVLLLLEATLVEANLVKANLVEANLVADPGRTGQGAFYRLLGSRRRQKFSSIWETSKDAAGRTGWRMDLILRTLDYVRQRADHCFAPLLGAGTPQTGP